MHFHLISILMKWIFRGIFVWYSEALSPKILVLLALYDSDFNKVRFYSAFRLYSGNRGCMHTNGILCLWTIEMLQECNYLWIITEDKSLRFIISRLLLKSGDVKKWRTVIIRIHNVLIKRAFHQNSSRK